MDADLLLARLARVESARLGPDVAYMRAHAIDFDAAWAGCGGVAVCLIQPRRDCRFDFVDDGLEAVVIEALGEDAEKVEDLIAWLPGEPDKWRSWAGIARALGTAAAVNPASYAFGDPLRIYRTPLGWLQAGCCGLVPLDMRWTARFLASIAGIASTLAPEDDEHAAEIAAARYALADQQRLVVPVAYPSVQERTA